MEMTQEIATKLTTFLQVNMSSVYASHIPLDTVTDRPFNIRCLTAEETECILVRWKTTDDEDSNDDAVLELTKLISNAAAFNRRHQLSDIERVIVIN